MSRQPAGPSTLLGDEEHVLLVLHCPHSQGILDDWTPKFDRMTRLLDLPVFHSMTQRDKIRVALGEPPPKLLKRQIRVWKTEALPLCGEFIRSLRRHMITIQLLPGDLTSDDEDASSSEEEDPEPLEPPDGYTFAPVPPTQQELEPLNPAGQALVGSHILYKWPRIGWQQGELVKWNDNPKCKNGKKQVNFHAHYSYDNTKPRHVLSLDHYNTERKRQNVSTCKKERQIVSTCGGRVFFLVVDQRQTPPSQTAAVLAGRGRRGGHGQGGVGAGGEGG